MSTYYRHLIEQGKLLDIYPNAAVAYSLRKLRDGYKKVFNLLTYSEDISQAVYSKSALITTSYTNVEIAPDGTMTADKLIEDTTNTTHFLTQQFSPLSVGLDYNFSVYLKAGERTKVSIQISGGNVRVNLLTGVIETNTTTSTPIVTNVGNGWWRFSILNIPAFTTANPLYRIFIVNALDSTSYVGDGVSGVYVWGFQLTLESSLLPYEKTVVTPSNGSAINVRRSLDNAEQDFGFEEINDILTDWVGYNLWSYSEQIQQSVWAKTNTTITTDTVVAPDGHSDADIAFETVTNGTHGISRGQSVINGEDYCVSFYIKANGRDYFQLRSAVNLSTNNINTPIARFELTSSSVIFDNGFFRVPPTITSVGNGWYKIEYGLVANSTTTSTALVIEFSTNGTTTSYTGDVTKGMAIWGLQISQTTTYKTYQKTEATAGGNAFVKVYYDQSGNGNNLTNATPSLQYRIVLDGHIYRNSDNGLPSTDVVSTGFYSLVSSVSTSNPYVNFNVYKSEAGNMILFGNSSVGGRPIGLLHNGSAGSRNILTRLTSSSTQDITIPFETNGSFITSVTRNTSNVVEITANDSLLGSSSLGTSTSAGLTVMGRYNSSANSSTGEIQELIIWKQNYVSLKNDISDKINEYYGIY